MRALLFDGKQPRLDPQYDEPRMAPGEAMIRPTRAGICATDLEICRGYMGFSGVLGHEFVGIVEKVHETADAPTRALVGKRVVGTINCACGRCDMCAGGLGNHCRQRTVLGISGRDGCFADRFTLPAANLLPVPDAIDDDHAVFIEPLAAACQVLRQVRIETQPYVTVLGDGRLGLLVAQVLAGHNASVRLVGKHPEKMALCEKWSVKHRPLGDLSPRADQDIVIDCTGSPEGLATAMQLVRPAGKIILKTTVAGQRSADLAPLVIHEIQLIGSRCGPFPDALALLVNRRIDVLSLISRRMKLSDGLAALKLAQQPRMLKVLLEFD
jgi:alcohol dehydrogenase